MTRLYLADVLKTNLTKFAVILSEKASKYTFLKPEKLQNHCNKEKGQQKKKRAGRKKGREEKRAMVALLVFIIATLEIQTFTTKDCKGPQTNMPENVGSVKT